MACEDGRWRQRSECCCHKPRISRSHQKSAGGQRIHSPSEHSRRHQPWWHLDFRHLASMRQSVSLVLSHPACSPRKVLNGQGHNDSCVWKTSRSLCARDCFWVRCDCQWRPWKLWWHIQVAVPVLLPGGVFGWCQDRGTPRIGDWNLGQWCQVGDKIALPGFAVTKESWAHWAMEGLGEAVSILHWAYCLC